MGGRSLRIEHEKKLQRARLFHYELLSSSVASPPSPPSSYIADPPIFLPSSASNSFTPSPSPLVPADGSHHEVPTAAIIGGGVASVVAVAATVTIASAVAGKVGLTCLLGPMGKLLSFLFENFMGSACGERLNSIRKSHQDHKRRKSNGAGSDADDVTEGSTSEWETQSSASNEECSVVGAHSLSRSPPANVDEGDEDVLKRRKLVHTSSKELQVVEEAAIVPALQKQEISHPGGAITNIPPSNGTMISMPTTEKRVVLGNGLMLPTREIWQEDDVSPKIDQGRRKRKRHNNLGHVSLSCDMSLHYLRLFTACKSGGMYGSPMASPTRTHVSGHDHQHQHHANHHRDKNEIAVPHYQDHGKLSDGQQTYVPVYNPSPYSFMHRQLIHPSKSILVQHNPGSATPFATQQRALVQVSDTKLPLYLPSKPFAIDDYGGPFDGIL